MLHVIVWVPLGEGRMPADDLNEDSTAPVGVEHAARAWWPCGTAVHTLTAMMGAAYKRKSSFGPGGSCGSSLGGGSASTAALRSSRNRVAAMAPAPSLSAWQTARSSIAIAGRYGGMHLCI